MEIGKLDIHRASGAYQSHSHGPIELPFTYASIIHILFPNTCLPSCPATSLSLDLLLLAS